MKPRYLFAILPALALALLLWPSTAQAQEDVTPPVLVDVAFEPSHVDTSAGAQTVTVTVRVTDDLSGLYYAVVQFASERSEQTYSINFNPDFVGNSHTNIERVEGDRLDGVWRGSFEMHQYAAHGEWRLTDVGIGDLAGNRASYDYPGEARTEDALVWPARFNEFSFYNGAPDAVPERTLYLPTLLR